MSHRDVYTAIADPTRREILDLLFANGSLVAGDIADHFEDASRPGISRHLRVLRECGVVKSWRDGKTQNYAVDPKPFRELHAGRLAKFGDMQIKSLKALRARAEK